MDKSKKYILMCSKAEEIQNNIKPTLEDGDFYIMRGRVKVRVFSEELWELGLPGDVFEGEKPIWLPRIDQLASLITTWNKDFPITFFQNISSNYRYRSMDFSIKESLEMTVLRFFMAEKAKLVWSDKKENWIPIKR